MIYARKTFVNHHAADMYMTTYYYVAFVIGTHFCVFQRRIANIDMGRVVGE